MIGKLKPGTSAVMVIQYDSILVSQGNHLSMISTYVYFRGVTTWQLLGPRSTTGSFDKDVGHNFEPTKL
jgi:hypothetical protein